MNLEEKVQSLLTAANAATGEADTNLTDAVGTLIAGQGGGSILPAGYTQMEYIEGSGTQAIDTDLTTNNDMVLDADVQMIRGVSGGGDLLGVRLSGGGTTYVEGTTTGTYAFLTNVLCFWGTTFSLFGSFPAKYRIRFLFDKSGVRLYDSSDYIISEEGHELTVFSENRHIALFASTSGTTYGHNSIVRFYRFRYLLNGALLADMIPAMRDSDRELGMYDIVRNRFFTNVGTGNFIGGAL